MGNRDDYRVGGSEQDRPITNPEQQLRRDALARNLCARICDDRRTAHELRQVDRALMSAEVKAVEPDVFRVYIGGASTDLPRVLAMVDAAKGAGLDVISTWPAVVAKTPGGGNPLDASIEQRFDWSSVDLAEVERADALWMLVPSPAPTRGAWVEAGFAHALGKHLVFSGQTMQSIFCALGEEFADDRDALRYLARVARDRREARRMSAGLRELATFDVTDTEPRNR